MLTNVEERLTLRLAVEDFLFEESALLDDGRFREWLDLVTEDIRYLIPVQTTRERAHGSAGSTTMAHWDDDYTGLEMRILRLDTEYAWAEDPPSKLRHFVSNVRVRPGSGPDEYEVRSNVMVSRSRGDSRATDLLTAERQDTLRRTDQGFRLARRTVVLDHVVIATHNLAFFF
ncbi:aromatic-ring-hydroxylating dioxygenase subunit beta [Pseudonocardia sp.]|uniref:aromatic-ring-hydroxylating dioxygenase subunit beta n=1 Tax=Pseudonocardia sp. TaxID=60912 RepID=UPI00261EBBCC|nr:aromatic-ring-hydroxylating dioxygenase subunit beta [Pseudonocardia sp.]